MKSWRNVTINDLGQIITGSTPPTKKTEYYGNKYPFITPTDIEVDSRIVQTDRFLSQEGYEYNKNRLLPRNAVCVVCIASIGKICMTTVPSVTNQQINSVVVNQQKYDPYFVYYLLRTKTDVLKNIAGGVASPIVNKSTFANLEVYVPPLPTQHKIAAILSTYDNLIENNTRRIKILEDMAQTLYREWFVHYRFPGHENVPIVQSELGPIPQGWEVVQFSDILDLVRNGINPTKFPEETFAHFSIPAFDNERMPLLENGDSIRSSKYLVIDRCVLLSKLNPRIPRVWFPFLNTAHSAIASTEFLILKPKPPVHCMFLYNLFRSPEFTDMFAVRALGTSGSHQRVKPDDFLSMLLAIPTKSLLKDFQKKVSPLVNICNTYHLKNANLRHTRDLLLPKLISGEIDVSELDIDTNEVQPKKGGTYIPFSLTERLHSDKKILGGKPVIKGTRLSATFILDLLKQGWCEEDIIENYPRITKEDIEACHEYQKVTRASISR